MYELYLQKLSRQEARIAQLEQQLVKARADIETLHKCILRMVESRINERDDLRERLCNIEDKLFPNFGSDICRVAEIIGGFDGWNLNNALDRRDKTIRRLID
jgi:hypothetical protein